MIVSSAGLVGCGSGGELTLQPVEGEVGQVLAGGFDMAVYSAEDHQTVHAIMLAGSEDAPRRAMVVRMFWRPRGGRTPFDTTATNATIRYIEFTDDGAVIYGGGGLVRPRNKAGAARFTMTMRDARLALLDATEGAVDPETAPKLTVVNGGFTAVLDEDALTRVHQKLQVYLNEKLGYPRLVDALGEPAEPAEPIALTTAERGW